MRILLFIALLLVAGCSLPAPLPDSDTEHVQSSDTTVMKTDETLGEHEGMPEGTESLEIEDVPADETGLIPIAVIEGSIILGNPDAPRLTLFTDYTCSYCADVSRAHVPWMLETYVQSGTLSLEIAFLPTDEKGILSAKTALCASLQEVFAPADKALYEVPLSSEKELTAFAKKIGADAKELTACVQDAETTAIIGMHSANAEAVGITRVPGFSLGEDTWLGVATKEGLQREIETAL